MRKEKSLLSDRAYARVKDGILSRTYTPDTPLAELDLSHRLGIGRTPVREALRRLREEGLVRVVQNRGAFVERMSYTDIEEALFLRELLEVAALHRGISRLPHDRLTALRAAFVRCVDASQPFPTADCLAADVALHELIVDAACSPRLKKFHKQLADQIYFLRHLQSDRMRASISEHLAIIDALQTGDATEAERALRQHMTKIRENLYQNRHLL